MTGAFKDESCPTDHLNFDAIYYENVEGKNIERKKVDK